MYDKLFKTLTLSLLGVVIFLLWMGLDVNTEDFDDPNTVSIEYECDKLDEYEKVPTEVIEECKDRSKE